MKKVQGSGAAVLTFLSSYGVSVTCFGLCSKRNIFMLKRKCRGSLVCPPALQFSLALSILHLQPLAHSESKPLDAYAVTLLEG